MVFSDELYALVVKDRGRRRKALDEHGAPFEIEELLVDLRKPDAYPTYLPDDFSDPKTKINKESQHYKKSRTL